MNKHNLYEVQCITGIEFKISQSDSEFLDNLKNLNEININLELAKFHLSSKDYSRAKAFQMEYKTKYLYHLKDHDGEINEEQHDFYPQFYFTTKIDKNNYPVLIQHEGFYKDSNILLKSQRIRKAYGIYEDENEIIEYPIDYNLTFSFFEKMGVKKNLISELKEKTSELYLQNTK
jgi:hypothetical protein